MARKITKHISKFKNDVVLTIALIISLCVTQIVLKSTGLNETEYDTILFFVFNFAFVKFFYYSIGKTVSYFFRSILKWEEDTAK